MPYRFPTFLLPVAFAFASLLPACVLAPAGAEAEQGRVAAAGEAYRTPAGERRLPDLPPEPAWRDILHRAFLANGDIESAYFEWSAAVHRVDMAATYPNSNVQLGVSYMFSPENLKAWDRTTIAGGFDPSMNLKLPQKVRQAGQVALDQARAAGLRFEAVKFAVQEKVLTAFFDFALLAEKARLQREMVDLLKMTATLAGDRVRAGAPQQDLLKAQMQYRLAENELTELEARLAEMRAMLNGMLARPADALLVPPRVLPEPRPLSASDADLIAVAVDRNPELASLAHEVAGRKDALALAKMAYLPDINVQASVNGNISQTLGAMVMLPTTIPMIEGQINEARTMLAAAEAAARQTRSDRAAAFVAALYAMRNAEHHAHTFDEVILPKARETLSSSREAYAAGQITLIELLDSQRTLLDVRQLIAEARIAREKRLVELETLAGLDFETLSTPAAAAAGAAAAAPARGGSQPTNAPAHAP